MLLVMASGMAYGQATGKRPNILWLTSEDNNVTYLGCYGNEMAVTPNIDRLAKNGFRYTYCYSNGAVCSASRTSWIVGMNAITMGGQNHRSRVNGSSSLVYYPAQLRKAGYFTGNFKKKDYNVKDSRMKGMWDRERTPDWNELKANQPFFQVINHLESHESRAMGLDHIHDPAKVKLPPYHPDTPTVRANYAHYYDAITRMDRDVGKALQALEEQGLAENTIVIYNSDHGGPLPRGKRYMYDSGTHCPLVIRIPKKYKSLWPAEKPGSVVERLVSFIDMPATWLSLAGAEIPSNYQGNVFLGENQTPESKYHFSFRGRNDARIENARAIRDKQFLYVRNLIPYVPRGQYLDYQWKIPMQRAWEEEFNAGRCNDVTGRFFKEKATEELYDVSKDAFCIKNLAENPEYKEVLANLSQRLTDQQVALSDSGMIPESELSRRVEQNNSNPYDVVHNPALYDLDAYMQVAAVALERDPACKDQLLGMLKHPDSGVRYWGVSGLFMIRDQVGSLEAPLNALLTDDSHNVRAMAAWTLIELNGSKKAYSCMENMIQTDSYALLEVLNIVDWMGAKGKVLTPTVAAAQITGAMPGAMKNYLVNGMPSLGSKKNKTGKKQKTGKNS